MVDYKTVTGFTLTLAEREFLKEAADGCRSIVSIEEGPGASLWCLRAGAPKAAIYGISVTTSHIGPDIWAEDPNMTLLEVSGREAAGAVKGSIDLLLVDGLHSFKGVLCDLVCWTDRVSPGGLVILHDYRVNHMPEVKEAVDFWVGHITRKTWQPVEAPDSLFALRRIVRRRKSGKQPQGNRDVTSES